MEKPSSEEIEYKNAMELFQAEASKNAMTAFNEGYLMGMHHAETIYGKVSDENQSKAD